MLKELEVAASLDPGWRVPRERLDSTWNFLTTMSSLVSSKVIYIATLIPCLTQTTLRLALFTLPCTLSKRLLEIGKNTDRV